MLLDGIILKCSASLKTHRTHSAIYNILKGAKAIQTILDVHLYQLKNVYGIYPSLHKKDFDDHIKQLIGSGHLLLLDENKIERTPRGEELQKKCEKTSAYHYFNGFQYTGISEPFIERLLLTIQTFTNKQVSNNQFIPVVDDIDIQHWVRQYYHRHKQSTSALLKNLHDELYKLLEQMPENEARLFVDRLTGYNHYGSSLYQLHHKYHLSIHDVPLILEGITHRFLSIVSQEKKAYPMLNTFIDGIYRFHFLTNSAKKTYRLYQKGYQADEIATMRKLKVNTIHDHLVEIALYDSDFTYQPYVTQTEAQIILEAIQKTDSYKLKDIKALINADITYFQIRLVLALMGNINGRM